MKTMIVVMTVMMAMLVTSDGKPRTFTPNNYITVQVDCQDDRIEVLTRMLDPFSGVLYSRSREGRRWAGPNSCRVRGSGRHEVSLSVSYGDCGWREVVVAGGRRVVYLELYVQYDTHVQQVLDDQLTVQCDMDRREADVAMAEVAGVGRMGQVAGEEVDNIVVNSVGFVSDQPEKEDKEVVHKLVENRNKVVVERPSWKVVDGTGGVYGWLDLVPGSEPYGPPLARVLEVGERVSLVMRVRQPPGRDTAVEECHVYSGRGGPAGEAQQLTDKRGCSLDREVVPDMTTSYNSMNKVKIIHTTFQAFKFPGDRELVVKCRLRVCRNRCGVSSCDDRSTDNLQGLAEDDDVGEVLLVTSALVDAPHVEVEEEEEEEEDVAEDKAEVRDQLLAAGKTNSYMEEVQDNSVMCLSPSRIILAFGILLMILVLALLFSCVLWFKARGQARPRPPGHPRQRLRGPYVIPPRTSPYIRVVT